MGDEEICTVCGGRGYCDVYYNEFDIYEKDCLNCVNGIVEEDWNG